MRRSHLLIWIIAAVLLVTAGVWWAIAAAQNPARVFTDMLANNLSTSSVTRILKQGGQGLSVSQYTQLNLGQNSSAHAITVFDQNGGSIVTEEISNRTNDFVRYKKVDIAPTVAKAKDVNLSGVVGQWAKLGHDDSLGSSVTTGLFDQALLGILPMGNFTPKVRQQLLATVKDNSIFTYDASKVKREKVDGHTVYTYPVEIKAAAYVALMQQFGKLVGANEYSQLNPSDYASSQTTSVSISVDVHSHNLVQINEAANAHIEQYEGYGMAQSVALPKATLTTKQLEDRIASLEKS